MPRPFLGTENKKQIQSASLEREREAPKKVYVKVQLVQIVAADLFFLLSRRACCRHSTCCHRRIENTLLGIEKHILSGQVACSPTFIKIKKKNAHAGVVCVIENEKNALHMIFVL